MARSGTFVRAGSGALLALLLAFVALQAGVAAVTVQQYFAGTVHLPGFPSNKKFSVSPTALSQALVVEGRTVRLSPSDIRRALPRQSIGADDSNATVALKMFDGTCLLIGRWSGANYCVELIDTRGLGWFARYEFTPEGS